MSANRNTNFEGKKTFKISEFIKMKIGRVIYILGDNTVKKKNHNYANNS